MKLKINTLALTVLAGSLATTFAADNKGKEYDLNLQWAAPSGVVSVWGLPTLSSNELWSSGFINTDNSGVIDGVERLEFVLGPTNKDYAVFAADVAGTIGNKGTDPLVRFTIKGPGYYVDAHTNYSSQAAVNLSFTSSNYAKVAASSVPAYTTTTTYSVVTASTNGTGTNAVVTLTTNSFTNVIWSMVYPGGYKNTFTNSVAEITNGWAGQPTTNYAYNKLSVAEITNGWAGQPTTNYAYNKLSGTVSGTVKLANGKGNTVTYKKLPATYISGSSYVYTLSSNTYSVQYAGGLSVETSTNDSGTSVIQPEMKNAKFVLLASGMRGGGTINDKKATYTGKITGVGSSRGQSFALSGAVGNQIVSYDYVPNTNGLVYTNATGLHTNFNLSAGVVYQYTNASGVFTNVTVAPTPYTITTNGIKTVIAVGKSQGQKVSRSGINVQPTVTYSTNLLN